ncbi:helicase with zinc finger domain 2-like [Pomacea canaliculata]|uniref:helicase with zinc finger domain 2-like n=1 Tax=Pomacea canaliculata TaxID=400727 RepID=UPI000D7267A2|nr:helicase with zinc finger domain 2-like [Pomacea canaliculata]
MPVSVLSTFLIRCQCCLTLPESLYEIRPSNHTKSTNVSGCPYLRWRRPTEQELGDSAVVIENVKIEMKCVHLSKSSGQQEFYQGTFSLPAKFCFDRGIEFGGKSAGSIGKEDEYKSNSTCPMDYLCIRCRVKCEEPTVSRVQQSYLKCVVDDHYTWIGHGGVIHVEHKNRQDADGGRLAVTFLLSRHSSVPPSQLLSSTGDPVTLEILPKSQVDRRAQEMLFQLEEEGNKLAQAIAYNKRIPQLDKDRRALGFQLEFQETNVPGVKLPRNNKPQHDAIVTALTNSVSLIQGPPGTGKTYTGIKLIYLFTQINRRLAEDGKGKKIVLFCGPSNKAVDLVARLLKLKFGNECPKMVRLYGSAIESKDYPIPRCDLQSSRGMRDLKSEPELQDVSLHHIIRESDKPYAEKIATFDKYFDKCRSDPENFKVTSKQIKAYKRLLHDASVEELAHHEVIFATCAVGGNSKLVKATKGSIFQVIIDECAMSPEPHSLVPIVANKAKQVVLIGDYKQLRPIITCQGAAELGLDQSLFERLYEKSSVPRVFLSTQYRMHPKICKFPSIEFYDGQLKTGIEVKLTHVLPIWPAKPKSSTKASDRIPHILVDVRGEEKTLTVSTDEGNERSKSNSAEADKVIEILQYLKQICAGKRLYHEIDAGTRFKELLETNQEEERKDLYGLPEIPKNTEKIYSYTIKVLTQYNAQRHLLEEKLEQACKGHRGDLSLSRYDKNNITVGTVVSSQGGEWDYVVLSTVRSLPSYKIEPRPTLGWCRQNMGFITDQNQVNVALTRACHGLIIVGNAELLKCDPVWNRLVTKYEELGCVYQSADFPPPLPQQRPRVKSRRQPVASKEWQQVRSGQDRSTSSAR